MDETSLLKLKYACAIIANDRDLFKEANRDTEENHIKELFWLLPLRPKDLREAMGAKGRNLMVSALSATVGDGDQNAVEDILKFAKEQRILLHIPELTVSILNKKRDFAMMKLLIDDYCYLR